MTQPAPHPVEAIRAHAAEVADGFLALRKAIGGAGAHDFLTTEIILLAGFATRGEKLPVQIHARRLLEAGMEAREIRQIVLILFGATMTMIEVSRTMEWLDEALA